MKNMSLNAVSRFMLAAFMLLAFFIGSAGISSATAADNGTDGAVVVNNGPSEELNAYTNCLDNAYGYWKIYLCKVNHPKGYEQYRNLPLSDAGKIYINCTRNAADLRGVFECQSKHSDGYFDYARYEEAHSEE